MPRINPVELATADTGVQATLGAVKAKENADKWGAFSDRMVAKCNAVTQPSTSRR